MTRTFFGLLGLTLLAALLPAYIRYELMEPGISALSTDLGGDAPGTIYNAAVALHGLAGPLVVFLWAAFAGWVAHRNGSATGRALAVLCLVLGAVLGAGVVASAVSLWSYGEARSGLGWVLYPPLSAPEAGWPPFGSLWYQVIARLPLLMGDPALTLTISLLTATALAGTGTPRPRIEWALAAAAIVLGVWLYRDSTPTFVAFTLVALAIGVFAALRQGRAVTAYLATGLGLLVLLLWGLAAFAPDPADVTLSDTTYVTGSLHLQMGTLGLFLGFATLVIWLRPRLHSAAFWGHGVLLGLATVAAFAPMLLLGRQGMPRSYIDYPDAFATWNRIASLGSLSMLQLIVVGGLAIWIRRAR